MEQHEKNLITANLVELVKMINMSSTFMNHFSQNNIFSEEDVEQIDSHKTRAEKVSALLRLLMTRVNGFQILCQALKDSNQSGVLKILGEDGNVVVEKQNVATEPEKSKPAEPTQNARDPAEDVIVGNPECSIPEIMTVIMESPVKQNLKTALNELSLWLSVERSDREEIIRGLEKGDIQLIDAVERVLYLWRAKRAKGAKLSDFLNALNKCTLQDLADDVRKKFVR